ncbi:phage tail tape measure protein [Elizabethkingia anophelis]|uniref:phage tail tape measure protein n=1 Tax=Elizabethkingia anophelis TaxID=1117645 RepID=UPI003209E9E2
MSQFTTTWRLEFKDGASNFVKGITDKLKVATGEGNKLVDCFKNIKNIDLFAIDQSVQNLKDGLQGISDLAIKNESALAEVSAITGAHGKELDALNDKAKKLAVTYGEDVNINLDAFKTILSRLGPEMGSSDKAMGMLGESVNILSKTMEGDITGATDAITTSMLQFQVDLKDPVKAAEESKRMINVMAAGAKEGAAEIPQIGQSLVQAGVSAKLANLTFEETNAAIQAMAEGGKYGSEAGVAIRNVITNMSSQTKLSKDAVKILEAYGVNMKKMADTTVPFADRLRELKPIQKDINALTEVFGRENAAAGQILIRSADSQEELTKMITGTNVAYEQAGIIMNTTFEKEKRRNQEWNLFKMRIGEVTKQYQPYINVTANAISVVANLKNAMDGLRVVWNAVRIITGLDALMKWLNSVATTKLTKDQLQLMIVTNRLRFAFLWASISGGGLTGVLTSLRVGIRALSVAIMEIPLIGWILAIIAALIALFTWLWNNVGEFRGFFYAYWEIVKTVWGGIWDIIKVVVELLVDHIKFLWESLKTVFGWIKEIVSSVWNWVASKFMWAWGVIRNVAIGIWNTIKSVFGPVYNFFKSVFDGVLNYVTVVFNAIWQRIQGFLQLIKPLTDAVGKVWEKVTGNAAKGYQKGINEVKKEKDDEKIEEALSDGRLVKYNGKIITKKRYDAILQADQKALINPGNSVITPTKTIDYDKVFADKDKKKGDKKGKSSGEGESDGVSMSGSKGPRTINMTLTINNSFAVGKGVGSIEHIANKITGSINDRLRDGLVALD